MTDPGIFSVQRSDDVTVLRFVHDALAGVDLNRMRPLWDFLERQRENPSKVLLVDVPSGFLSPQHVDRFLNGYLHSLKKPGVEYRLREDLAREENALLLLAERLSSLDSFVVIVLRGEVDLPFLGVALSCDYRILSDVTVFRNRILDGGLPPCGGLHWHLSRFLGFGTASHLLTTSQSISASEAHKLDLVDDVFALDEIEERVTEVVGRFAGKPRSRLVAMKHLLQASHGSRDQYLSVEEREINHCVSSIVEEAGALAVGP